MPWTFRSAVLPGALLALLVTCSSLLALAVVVGLRSDQHQPLSFGGREATVTLQGTADVSSSSARSKADAPLLPERDAAAATRRVAAGVALNPADARADRARQPRATLRGTARRRNAQRPAPAPAPATTPTPAVAAMPAPTAAAAPAPTAAPELPSRTHRTGRPEGRTQPRADHRRRHDRPRGEGESGPDTPAPPAPAPAPAPETPAPPAPGEGHHRSHGPPWGSGGHGHGGWHRGDRG
jgi:hypothetical protein